MPRKAPAPAPAPTPETQGSTELPPKTVNSVKIPDDATTLVVTNPKRGPKEYTVTREFFERYQAQLEFVRVAEAKK